MISLASGPSISTMEKQRVTASSYTPRTVQTVIEQMQKFEMGELSGKIIIHTGISREGRRTYTVEVRRMITSIDKRR